MTNWADVRTTKSPLKLKHRGQLPVHSSLHTSRRCSSHRQCWRLGALPRIKNWGCPFSLLSFLSAFVLPSFPFLLPSSFSLPPFFFNAIGLTCARKRTPTRLGDKSFFPSPDRVSGTLCLSHYATEISHLYSLKETFKDTLVCVGLRRIVTVAFFCAVYKYSYLLACLLTSSSSFLLSGPHLLKQARESVGALWAPQRIRAELGRQTVTVHSEVKNRPLVSGESGVEEVSSRRNSVTSHKIEDTLKCWDVGHAMLIFWGYPGTHDTHSAMCHCWRPCQRSSAVPDFFAT